MSTDCIRDGLWDPFDLFKHWDAKEILNMQRHRGLLMSLALSAIIGLMGTQANAGPIQLSVFMQGVVLPIYSTSSSTPDTSVAAVLTTLNTALSNHHSVYKFVGLNAQSTYLESANGSLQTTFQMNTQNTGTLTNAITIEVTQDGFLTPPAGPGGLTTTSIGGSFLGSAGSLAFTSDYQGANVTTYNFSLAGSGGSSSPNPAPSLPIVGDIPSSFSLSNHIVITGLTKSVGAFVGGTGGIVVSAVPEPSSFITMLMGMPLPLAVVFGLIRRRLSAA
jgi:hypothetical protein